MTSYISRFGRKVANRDGWKCHYCGIDLVPVGTPETDNLYYESRNGARHIKSKFKLPTIDHVKPLARGGRTRLNNLVLACQLCNNQKADKPSGQLKLIAHQ